MATAEEYATWIVANADKRGTPEFNTVAQAYNLAKGGMVPKPKAPIETPQFEKDAAANLEPGIVSQIGRQLGLTARAGIKGVTAIPAMVGDAIGMDSSGAVDRALSMVGLPAASNPTERVAQDVAGALAGTGGMAKVGALASGPLKQLLTQNLGTQAAMSAGGAGGSSIAREGGAGPVGQLAAGVAGSIAPVAGAAVGQAGYRSLRNIIDDMLSAAGSTSAAQRQGGRVAVAAAGQRTPQVINALENSTDNVPGSNLTAGQAAVPANSAEFAALQKIAEQANPSIYAGPKGVDAAQENARKALIQTIAEDPAFANPNVSNLRAAQLVRDANAVMNFDKVRGDMINPIAPEEVFAARIAAKEASKAGALRNYGQLATEAAQQDILSQGGRQVPGQLVRNEAPGAQLNRLNPAGETGASPGSFPAQRAGGVQGETGAYPVLGQPRVPPRYTNNADRVGEFQAGAQDAMAIATQRQKEADFIKYQLDSLIKTVGPENPKLAQLLQRPSMQKALIAAQNSAQETGSYFPAKQGAPFTVGNLQRMKMALDDVTREPDKFGIAAAEAKEILGTRQELVHWLAKRSNGWNVARKNFADDSIPINRMEIGKVLGNALDTPTGVGDRPTAFANAMENARLTQRKAGNAVRYDTLDEALGPEGIAKAKMVMRDFVNNAEFDKMASSGASAASKTIRRENDVIKQVPTMSSSVKIFNFITRHLEGLGGDKAMKQLAIDMQNPKKMAQIMRDATPQERMAINEFVMRLGPANVGDVKERQP